MKNLLSEKDSFLKLGQNGKNYAKKHFSKSGRLQKKIDKQNKSAAKSQANVDKKADIAAKQKELATATAKAKAARKADTGTEKTKGEIVKQKARIAGKKVVKGIKQGVKNFVFGKKKPADKPASSPAPVKKDAPAPSSSSSGSKSPALSDTQKQKNTMLKHKLQKRKKEREGGVDIKHQKMEQFKKQWQQSGIQDSHDLSVYYDVLAGKTEK